MPHLWISILAITLLHSARASGEHLRERDETTCANEACGPYPLPIPMARRKIMPDKTAPGSQESYYGRKLAASEEIKTNFSCNEKPYIPGFYADMEAECRIFHLCLSYEVDNFLCPPGTAFNQSDLVCKPFGEVDCHLSPTFYHLNRRLVTGPSTIPETKESVPDKESDRWLYDLLKGEEPCNATAEDILERNLIRMLILMQFSDMTDLLTDLVYPRDSKDNATESSENSSNVKGEVLKRVIQEVFPLLPVKFGTEQTSRSWTLEALKGARDMVSDDKAESSSRSFSWGNGEVQEETPERPPLEIAEEASAGRRPLDLSKERPELSISRERNAKILNLFGSRKQRAIETAKTIINIIGIVAGKISKLARDEVVTIYVDYIDYLLHEILSESP